MTIPRQVSESLAFCAAYEVFAILCEAVQNTDATIRGINHRLELLGVTTRVEPSDVAKRSSDAGTAIQRQMSGVLAELRVSHPDSVAASFALPGNAFLSVARRPVEIEGLAHAADHANLAVGAADEYQAIRAAFAAQVVSEDELAAAVTAWVNSLYREHRAVAAHGGSSRSAILDAIDIKPSFLGITIDAKKIIERAVAWFRQHGGAS